MLGHMAIGLAAAVGLVPAALAQDSGVLDHCKSAGAGAEADVQQAHQQPGNNMGVSVAVPIGRVCLDPEVVDGQPIYVRRTTVKEGMAIVEVSTTPFMPVLGSSEETPGAVARPDQPAGW